MNPWTHPLTSHRIPCLHHRCSNSISKKSHVKMHRRSILHFPITGLFPGLYWHDQFGCFVIEPSRVGGQMANLPSAWCRPGRRGRWHRSWVLSFGRGNLTDLWNFPLHQKELNGNPKCRATNVNPYKWYEDRSGGLWGSLWKRGRDMYMFFDCWNFKRFEAWGMFVLQCFYSVSPMPFDLDTQGWKYNIVQPCL